MNEPTITIGLADKDDMTKVLPLPTDNVVRPDAKGRVKFRARVEDADGNLVALSMSGPNSSSSMSISRSAWGTIGLSWDVRRTQSGAKANISVIATDASGQTTAKTVSVTLQK